jgi:hypothetical protein
MNNVPQLDCRFGGTNKIQKEIIGRPSFHPTAATYQVTNSGSRLLQASAHISWSVAAWLVSLASGRW